MGANTGRVTTVLVSNAIAANTTFTNVQSVQANDVVLINRNNAQVADTGKVSDAGNDLLYVVVGEGGGKLKYSNPIQPTNIRKIRVTPFEATTQHKIVVPAAAIPAASLVAGAEFGVGVIYQDDNRIFAELPTREYFYFKAGATAPTATDVFNGIAARINGAKLRQLTATVTGGTLVIEGLPVDTDNNGINQYQFRYFHAILRGSFDANVALTVTTGKPGRGIGMKVIDLEQASLGRQLRTMWPIRETPKRALSTGTYNIVTIEHGHEHVGDLQQPQVNPVTTLIAFQTAGDAPGTAPGTGFPSAKQNAFMTKLTSIATSAGKPIG
jgi:hypothetical protein